MTEGALKVILQSSSVDRRSVGGENWRAMVAWAQAHAGEEPGGDTGSGSQDSRGRCEGLVLVSWRGIAGARGVLVDTLQCSISVD